MYHILMSFTIESFKMLTGCLLPRRFRLGGEVSLVQLSIILDVDSVFADVDAVFIMTV